MKAEPLLDWPLFIVSTPAALLAGALLLLTGLGAHAQSPQPDSLNPGANNVVSSLAEQADGKIVVGGAFYILGGQTRTKIGRLNADGTLDTGFNPGSDISSGSSVRSLAMQADGKIVLGGGFSTLGGQMRHGIGRLNADGTVDTGFVDPQAAYGDVHSLAVQADGKILVGGGFTALGGQPRSSIGRLNADGTLDTGFVDPGANGELRSLAMQADGKILVGGGFTTLGGQTRSCIGRLNADGTLDPSFNPGANNTVYSLAMQADGKILVGGYFTTLGGQTRNYIGRLNADGTLDPSFNPGANGFVYSLAVQTDGKILAGGYFSTLGGQARNRIGRLNADGTLDPSFNPGTSSSVGLPTVFSLAVQADGKILVAGDFRTLGGQPRTCIGRLYNTDAATQSLSYDSSAITWLRGGASPEVWRTTFDYSSDGVTWTNLGDGNRITGGWQLTAAALPATGHVRARGYVCGGRQNGSSWFVEDYTGAPILLVQPGARTNNATDTVTMSVMAKGPPPLSYQWFRNGARLMDGGNLSGTTNPILTLTNVLGGDAGGYTVVVTNVSGSTTSAVAQLTVVDPWISTQPVDRSADVGMSASVSVAAKGTLPLSYQWWHGTASISGATNVQLTVTNLQTTDAGNYFVVVSNLFGSVTSSPVVMTVNLIAIDTNFNPGADGYVSSLAVQADGKILTGGYFSTLGGQTRGCIGRLNPDGTLDTNFNPGADGYVSSLAVQADGKILTGGLFSTLGGQTRGSIGRLNADGTLDLSFNLGADYSVYSLAVQADGKILTGGHFSTLGEQVRSRIGRFNADGTLDPSFNPGANGDVRSLAVQADGKILTGGDFSTLGGQTRNCIGRLNADGTLDPGFNPGANNSVASLVVQADGKILVAGAFTTLGGQARNRIGRFSTDGTLDPSFNPGANNYVNSLAVQADGKILVGGYFTTLGGHARNHIGRLNADGTLDTTFNPGADSDLYSLAVQADGEILVGGNFTTLGGQTRSYLGRLHNTDAATQSLSYDNSAITWLRGGASPEVWRTTFDYSPEGVTWTNLGAGNRIPGGWQLAASALPASGRIRARGYVCGGQYNGSAWFVETSLVTSTLTISQTGPQVFLLALAGPAGSQFVVQTTSDLSAGTNWSTFATLMLTNSSQSLLWTNAGDRARFFRVTPP